MIGVLIGLYGAPRAHEKFGVLAVDWQVMSYLAMRNGGLPGVIVRPTGSADAPAIAPAVAVKHEVIAQAMSVVLIVTPRESRRRGGRGEVGGWLMFCWSSLVVAN